MTNHPNPIDDDSEQTRAFEQSTDDYATLLPPSGSAPHDEYATLDQSHGGQAVVSSSHRRSIKYFGDYEILSEIARGGMGVVYKARQSKLNRIVAVKMILSGELASQEAISRFFTEAQAAATLDHPGIVPVYEIGDHEGKHYFTMGYIEGKSLAEKVSQGPLPPKEAAEMTRKIAEAIAYAHSKGVIHRDLKPANVLLDANGEPKVSDFGLARKIEQDSGLTRTGAVMGTPSYMPPEQAAGKTSQVGPLSDVYSLGAILYCLLTGRPPFQAANPLDTMMQVIEKEPVSVQTLNSGVPKDLETICHKCLQKDPTKRYGSAQQLAEDLQRWLKGEPIRARAVSRPERAWRWVKRNPVLSFSIAATTVAILLGSTAAMWFGLESKKSELRAKRSESEAIASAEVSRRNLYASRMNLAKMNWDSNRAGEAVKLLNDCESDKEASGLRGFEWNYLNRNINQYLTTIEQDSYTTKAVFSLDSRHVATAHEDGTVKLIDTETGKHTKTFEGHSSQVEAVAFSPNGVYLASGGMDQAVKIWNVITGEEVKTLSGHTTVVVDVAFSLDGMLIASASGDKTIKIWNFETGQESLTLTGHDAMVSCIAFSLDGKTLVSGSYDRTLKVWDLVTGKEIKSITGHTESVSDVGFSPDGMHLASASDDRTVKLWDVATWQEAATLKGHKDDVKSIGFSPDGRNLASAGMDWDPTVKIWDLETREQIVAIKGCNGVIRSVAFSPDGTKLLSVDDASLTLWDVTNFKNTMTLDGHTGLVTGLAFSPDKRHLASASTDETIKLWDLISGKEIKSLSGHTDSVSSIAYSPDGINLASGSSDKTVRIWDLSTGLQTSTLTGHTSWVTGVAYSPNNKTLASSSWDGIKVWDIVTGNVLHTFEGYNDDVMGIVFNRDGTLLASFGKDKVIFWDVATGLQITEIKGVSTGIISAAFSPDNTLLAITSSQKIIVWDIIKRKEALVIRGSGDFLCSEFSTDSKRLATGCWGETIKLWDVTTGQETFSMNQVSQHVRTISLPGVTGFAGRVVDLAFSVDNQQMAAACEGSIVIYDARPWTPETRLEQQALCLTRGMLQKSDTEEFFLTAIRENQTFTEQARNRALEYAPLFWRSKQRSREPSANQLTPQ
jgi:WD40 repeat protein/tRNA A-37 threonylcarbamoyl transferase component Bud32